MRPGYEYALHDDARHPGRAGHAGRAPGPWTWAAPSAPVGGCAWAMAWPRSGTLVSLLDKVRSPFNVNRWPSAGGAGGLEPSHRDSAPRWQPPQYAGEALRHELLASAAPGGPLQAHHPRWPISFLDIRRPNSPVTEVLLRRGASSVLVEPGFRAFPARVHRHREEHARLSARPSEGW